MAVAAGGELHFGQVHGGSLRCQFCRDALCPIGDGDDLFVLASVIGGHLGVCRVLLAVNPKSGVEL